MCNSYRYAPVLECSFYSAWRFTGLQALCRQRCPRPQANGDIDTVLEVGIKASRSDENVFWSTSENLHIWELTLYNTGKIQAGSGGCIPHPLDPLLFMPFVVRHYFLGNISYAHTDRLLHIAVSGFELLLCPICGQASQQSFSIIRSISKRKLNLEFAP